MIILQLILEIEKKIKSIVEVKSVPVESVNLSGESSINQSSRAIKIVSQITNQQFAQLLQTLRGSTPNTNPQNTDKSTATLADNSLPKFADRR